MGISRKVACSWKNKGSDAGRDFRQRWDDAMETAVELLEGEARRRALHGREEPVFHQGEERARVPEYSDALKAHKPQRGV